MDEELLRQAYGAFNARNIDAALALMQPAVRWPNGSDGGYVRGHGGLRQYWSRQWQELDPRVEPLSFHEGPAGSAIVDVRLTVRNKRGVVLKEECLQHVYQLHNGLIQSMEIRR